MAVARVMEARGRSQPQKRAVLGLRGGGRGQRAVARGLEDAEKAREQSQPQKQAQMLISVVGRW